MAQENDYYSFDDVINELSLDEGELKRMVSEGEIRAFKDADKMKFKKEDIERLRAGESTDPTVILPINDDLLNENFLTDAESDAQSPTTSFDETIGIDFADSSNVSDTIDVSSETGGSSTEQLEITNDLSDKAGADKSEDSTIVTDETTGLVTEAIPGAEDTSSDMKTVEDATVSGPAVRRISGGVSRSRTKAGSTYAKAAVSRPRVIVREKKQKHPVLNTILAFSVVILIIMGVYFSEIIRLALEGDAKFKPLGLPADVSNMFVGMFGEKEIQDHWQKIISEEDTAPKQ